MNEYKLPELGENITQCTVTKILVKAGDALKKGQNILEIETDKAVLEVPCTQEGTIKEILIKPGAVVKVGQPIFKMEGETAAVLIPDTHSSSSPSALRKDEYRGAPRNDTMQREVPGQDTPTAPAALIPARKDIPAAPSVRLLARELGIDIAQVTGSGPGGRISSHDVKAYCKMLNTSRPALASAGPSSAGIPSLRPLPDFSKWGTIRREAMSNVRRTTAEHVTYAWTHIPQVTQFDKADITELEKLRKNISGTNKKISATPFIIKVTAAALKKFPQFNASVDMASQEIIFKDYINIGVAVDTDRGLLVPVLKDADKKSILQIADELSAIGQRARLRKTTIEEMQGGCFTISNLGGIGGTYFSPIINWPQVAILGISKGTTEAVYAEGQIQPRQMLPLSLSYDHRVIDGADAARFLRWVCEAIEQPFLLELNNGN